MAETRASRGREGLRAALALGVGAVATATCLAVIHTSAPDAYWTGDCANKALVAQRLRDTGFRQLAFDHPAAAVDPAGRAFPLPDLGRPRGAERVSVFPVAYPALAAPWLAIGGPAALRWPAALGTGSCAALLCLWLAPTFGRRTGAAAGLAFGLATPLFFYGITVWEHGLAVAGVLGAVVMLGTGEDARRAAAAGALAGLATWLREETVLFVAAVAIVEVARQRSARPVLPWLAGAAVPGLALAGFNAWVYGTPLGAHAAALDPARALAAGGEGGALARLAAVVAGRGTAPAEALALAGAAVAALALGAVAEARGRGVAAALGVAATLGLGVWGLGFARILEGPALLALIAHNGWLATMPWVALAGAGAVRVSTDPRFAPLRPGIAAGTLFLGLALVLGLATQSVFGLGLHVGPRKLLAAAPALFALAVAALALRPPGAARAVAVAAAVALAGAGLAHSGLTAWLLHHQKAEGAALQAWIRARPEPYLVSGDALLTQVLTGVWHDTPTLHVRDAGTLAAVVDAMRVRGVRRFLVLATAATPIDDPALGLRCRRIGQLRGETLGYWNTDAATCRVLRAPPAGR